MKLLLLSLTFFFAVYASSQDTIRVFYDFGLSEPNDIGMDNISSLSLNYDLSILDSIHFIGYTDSVGNVRSNLKLSRKRAKNAYKLSRKQFSKDIPFSIFSRGEEVKNDPAFSRRVELILYYPSIKNEPLAEEIKNVDPGCFFIDFEALELCNVRTITKKRKRYAHIEAMNVNYFKDAKHYYVKKNSGGEPTVKRLKWRKKKTGLLWWRKVRYVADIPKKSFDKFQFFTLEKAPCDGCREKIFTEDTIIQEITKSYPDVFLMSNMQTRVKLFGKQKLKIRVPREYIDLTDKYFTSTDGYMQYRSQLISWQTKRGKRRQKYYYARVYMPEQRYPIIMKYRTTIRCLNKRVGLSGNLDRFWAHCYPMPYSRGIGGNFALDVGAGSFYQNDTVTGFLYLGLSYKNAKSDVAVKVGINHRPGLYLSGSYDYHFYSFPFAAINPLKSWRMVAAGKSHSVFGSFYGGAEVKTIFKTEYQSFLEANVHLGVSIYRIKSSNFATEFYLQSGIGRDLLNRTNSTFYPLVEVGVTFHLF